MSNGARAKRVETKYWILTIWPNDEWLDSITGERCAPAVEQFFNSAATREHVQYVRWQLERAPDTGRLHIQAVIQWKRQQGKRACLTKLGIPNQCFHAEPITFGWDKVVSYASKSTTRVGDFAYEWGTYTVPTCDAGGKPVAGAREDLRFAGEFLRGGGSVGELAALRPDLVIKYHKGLETVARYNIEAEQPGRRRQSRRRVFVLCGPTGTGKTSGVYKHYQDSEVFSPPVRQSQGIWFDGLGGQKVAVFDEFQGEIPFDSMKRFIDPWHNEMAPIKGTHAKLSCDVVFIISNLMPWQWWPKELSLERAAELNRRVEHWVYFGNMNELPQAGALGVPILQWKSPAEFDWGVGCVHPCQHLH